MKAIPKRLIEVDLPIAAVSAQSRREKTLRHGHISTLHIWWARRPLASARSALLGALWPDPADPHCPTPFVAAASKQMREFRDARGGRERNWSDTLELRAALLEFIAAFSNWDHADDRLFLSTARSLSSAAHEALGGEPGTRPLVVDPFAGGGAIPLEALRIGADSFASDLNSIPVLLNKVVLEYVPHFGSELVDRFREWGQEVLEEARKSLEELYPKDEDGAVPIAYLWARTIRCEGPGCGATIPLVRSTQLSRKAPVAHVSVVADGKDIRLELREGQEKKSTATISGGKATCPRCGYTTPAKRVKVQMTVESGGANTSRLFAVLVERAGSRRFRGPTKRDLEGVRAANEAFRRIEATRPELIPNEPINPLRPYANTRGVSGVTRFGMSRFIDLYTARQATAVIAFHDAIQAVRVKHANTGAIADALETLLLLACDRLVFQNTSLSRWNSRGSNIEGLFSKQALQIVWDFGEANPTHPAMASWPSAVEWVAKVLENNLVLEHEGRVERASAEDCPLPSDSVDVVCTDPPYFAAIPYADLSDVFHVWLRRGLRGADSRYFREELAEKHRELVVTNSATGLHGESKDEEFFATGMQRALSRARDMAKPGGIACIVFADSSTKAWDAMLRAVLGAGWVVTASWPIDTEMQNRTRAQASASLQSSIFLICRPREQEDGTLEEDLVGDWRDVLAELPGRIHDWMPRLAREGVVGADAIFACLGPALEIFSRYSRVERSNGDSVALAEYLEHVWAAVANEAMSTIFEGADAAELEADARLTAMWLWTIGAGASPTSPGGIDDEGTDEDTDDGDEDAIDLKKAPASKGYALDFDAARKIAQGLGAHLDSLGRLVDVKGDTARLLSVAERARHLFAGASENQPERRRASGRRNAQTALFAEEHSNTDASWLHDGRELAPAESTLDRVHQAMLLFSSGRTDALRRLLVEDGAGRDARFWRVAQSLSALYPLGTDEKRWVDGLLARRKGFNL